MEEKIILPQNTRLMGALLGFIGGGLDVFATCTTGVWSRPKRGTSCFSSLIGTIPVSKIPSCVFIDLFSRSAFWLPSISKNIARQPFGEPRCWFLCLCDTPDSLGVCHTTCRSSLYCFWNRDDDVDLYREPHRKSPLCDLYDFRQLSQDADGLVSNHSRKGDLDEYRRQAMNYGIVVGSFVAGAISVAILMHFIHQWAIWLITANLFLIMTYYTARVKQLGLQTDNL